MKNFIDNLFIEGDLGIGSDWAGGASSALHIKSSQPSITLQDKDTGHISLLTSDSQQGSIIFSADVTGAVDDSFISLRIDGEGLANEKMRIDSSGNVGIGTTHPDHKLEVKTPGGKYALSVVDDTNNEQHLGGLFVNDNGAITDGLDFYLKQPGGQTKVRIASSPDMDHYFNNGGNVGIGTTSPGVKLDVNGSIRGDSLTAVTNAGFSAIFSKTNQAPAIKFMGTPSSVGLNYAFAIDAVDGNNNKFELLRMNDADQTVQQLLTIQSNGNVGIGTTDPTSKLHVDGDTRIDGNLIFNPDGNTSYLIPGQVSTVFRNNLNSASLVTILNDGNVGIGITNPNLAKLQIEGDSDVTRAGLLISDVSGRASAIYQKGDILKFDDYTQGLTTMVIDGLSGRVGIGTTEPTSMLDIQTDSTDALPIKVQSMHPNQTGLRLTNGTGNTASSWTMMGKSHGDLISPSSLAFMHGTSAPSAENQILVLTPNGDVGIGTSTPAAALDVAGSEAPTIHLTEKTSNYSSRIGIPSAAGQVFSSDAIPGSLAIRNDTKIQLGGLTPLVTINGAEGNVGIGTSTPSAKLEIKTSGDEGIRINQTAGSPWNYLSFYQEDQFKGFVGTVGSSDSDLDGGLTLTALAGENLYLRTAPGTGANASNRVTILNSNGNVGIGYFTSSTPPTKTLDVNGDINFSGSIYQNGQLFESGGGGSSPWADAGVNVQGGSSLSFGGYVGINTSTTPKNHLHVVGGATIESTGPVLVLKDTDGGDVNSQSGYISYRDVNEIERGYVGFGSAGNKTFTIRNNIGDVDILTASAGGKIRAGGNEIITTANIAQYGGGGSEGPVGPVGPAGVTASVSGGVLSFTIN